MLALTSPLHAQDGTNVLLVVNDTSPDSQMIGAHYAEARHVPAGNVVHIKTAVVDGVERSRFDAEIEGPIAEAIAHAAAQDRILYIVLTKDIPLRVLGTTGIDGTAASVDSELTLLYRKLLGNLVLTAGRMPNPYFQGNAAVSGAKPFSHADMDIYLVTRLDGFTTADVDGLIARGGKPVKTGMIVLDQKGERGMKTGDASLDDAARVLRGTGAVDRVVLETTTAPAKTPAHVLGYYSWGSNDPNITARHLHLPFEPGALAATFVSTDARTFREPSAAWTTGNWLDKATFYEGSPQSLTGDLIRDGVTGVAGQVAEPFLDATIKPQVLFPAYLAGFNLAESFYLSMPFLSWQTVVVGDPLCAPFRSSTLSSEQTTPPLDPDTDQPAFFSKRRLTVLARFGIKPEIAKLLTKANARLTRGDVVGGRELLEKAVAAEPGLDSANLFLAGIYEQAAEYDKAAERYRAMLITHPNDVRALNNLAYLLVNRQGSPAEALPLADKAYRLASSKQTTADAAAAIIPREGTPVAAQPFAEEAFSVVTAHAQIADTLGWTHHLLGHETEADTYLTEAAEGDPQNAEILVHTATVKEALGQRDMATVLLKKALVLEASLENDQAVKQLAASLGLK